MITLPLCINEQPFGTLNVYTDTQDAFDSEEITLLGELADDLAFGITGLRTRIERQQALRQLQAANISLEKRNAELLALHEIAQTLTATLDVSQIYRAMYEGVAQRLFGAQHFTIALYDPERERIVADFSIVDGEEFDISLMPSMPLGAGPNSQTIRTRQARIVALPASGSGVTTPGNFIHIGDAREPLSALYVPLMSGNSVVGVMNLQHYDADAFQETDLKLLGIIANQAATAIQNARLFAATQQHAADLQAQTERLALVNRVSARLAQTLDVEMIYSIALNELQTALNAQYAGLMLFPSDAEGEFGQLVLDTYPGAGPRPNRLSPGQR